MLKLRSAGGFVREGLIKKILGVVNLTNQLRHSFQILKLSRALNYRPYASPLYEVASHVRNRHFGHVIIAYLESLVSGDVGVEASATELDE